MLRTGTIALAIAVTLAIAAPAAAMKGGGGPGGPGPGASHGPGPGSMMSHSLGAGPGGPGPMMSRSAGPGPGPGTFSRSVAVGGPSNNRFSMIDRDRDFGRRFDRDDRFRFHRRFFPTFAFGFNAFTDFYDDSCFVLQRVWTRHGVLLRRIWVCG